MQSVRTLTRRDGARYDDRYRPPLHVYIYMRLFFVADHRRGSCVAAIFRLLGLESVSLAAVEIITPAHLVIGTRAAQSGRDGSEAAESDYFFHDLSFSVRIRCSELAETATNIVYFSQYANLRVSVWPSCGAPTSRNGRAARPAGNSCRANRRSAAPPPARSAPSRGRCSDRRPAR